MSENETKTRETIQEKLKRKRAQEAEAAKNVVVVSEKETEMSNEVAEIIETVENPSVVAEPNTDWRSVQSAPVQDDARPKAFVAQAPLVTVSPDRDTKFDIVIITAEPAFTDFPLTDAILDVFNPRLVILDESSQTSRIAMAWAKSRGREFLVVPAKWDELGNSAGPLRNQEVLDMAREMIDEKGLTATQVVFGDDRHRAVGPFLRMSHERNSQFAAHRELKAFVIEVIYAKAWMDLDSDVSGAGFKVGNRVIERPEVTRMIGARRIDPNAVPVNFTNRPTVHIELDEDDLVHEEIEAELAAALA